VNEAGDRQPCEHNHQPHEQTPAKSQLSKTRQKACFAATLIKMEPFVGRRKSGKRGTLAGRGDEQCHRRPASISRPRHRH
jgi:hypothetical protein